MSSEKIPISAPEAVRGRDEGAGRILVADDQSDVLEALRMLLRQHGYQVTTANSPAAILQVLTTGAFDAVLMDLNYTRDTTSGAEGLTLLAQVHAVDEDLPVVVMTAWGTVELAVAAMHKGVGDFVLKPWDNSKLLEILRTQVAKGRERRNAQKLESQSDILQSEILEARKIQEGLLPRAIPRLPGFEISGMWQPSSIVGGDYYDIFELGESAVALCIGDVVGKGMPAALLMSNLQAAIRGVATETLQPRELCAKVNRGIRGNLAPEKFISLFYAVLDARARELTYANAGHNAPFLARRDGTLLRLDQGGPVIGVLNDGVYAQGEASLESGDRLVLFTDGVTEAANHDDEEFGEERLRSLLVENRSLGAPELQKRILSRVAEFCGGNFRDDVTLVVVSAD
jgi:sigma-B regulation protein RsbU (phosphoserine phosphatase)